MTGSWRTTVSGIASILTGLAMLARGISTGEAVDYGVALTAITTGLGLLFARDNKVSSESAGAK